MNNLRYLCSFFSRRFISPNAILHQRSLHYFRKEDIILQTTPAFFTKRKLYKEFYNGYGNNVDFPKGSNKFKYILYKNSKDPLIESLNTSESIQEVFDFMKKYDKILKPMHFVQIVLVLWDLQNSFYKVTKISSIGKEELLMKCYKTQLRERAEFDWLLHQINTMVNEFSDEALSCLLLYLNKMGMNINEEVMQKIIFRLKQNLNEESSTTSIARFFIAIFGNCSNNAYFICQDLIPIVYQRLDSVQSVNELRLITVCLNCLSWILPKTVVDKYKGLVDNFLDEQNFNSPKINCLLSVILFLNNLGSKFDNSALAAECVIKLTDKISYLHMEDIIFLFENFSKSHEPASILPNLQRSAAKYLIQLEDMNSPEYSKRLKLFSCVTHLPTNPQRLQHETMLRKYLDYPLDGEAMANLLRIMQYNKLTDPILCKNFWDKLLMILEHDVALREKQFSSICHLYINYFIHLPYRNGKFEKRINQWIEGFIETSVHNLIPSKYCSVAGFIIAFGNDVSIVNYITQKLKDNWFQLNAFQCVAISKGLNLGINSTRNPHLKSRYRSSLCTTIGTVVKHAIDNYKLDYNTANDLLKSCIHINMSYENPIMKNLLENYEKCVGTMSSKCLKNASFCLITTNSFIPSVIELLVNYVCQYKEHIALTNASKVASLCNSFGYVPVNVETFSTLLADMLIRDQEKISGLAYIQCCLALCFFNKITIPLIKQVFNVDFMEKLDLELKHCYGKDIYPLRVRRRLMELNRIICIDYPEANIPWFHQKYVEQYRPEELISQKGSFYKNVFNYLGKVYYETETILCDVMTPYGYNIDFELEYHDDNNKFTKLALLLVPSKAYTNVHVQLNGNFQTKIRHLEMFGYKVALLPQEKWSNLVYAEDKIHYIKHLLNLHGHFSSFDYKINR